MCSITELYIDLYIKYACGVIPSHELDLTGSNENNFSCVLSAENAKLLLVISSFHVMTDRVLFLLRIYCI